MTNQLIHFGGNDYLDLSRHPEVVQASCDAVREFGASTCASRVSVGTLEIHRQLEGELADFLGLDDAVVLSSGYVAALAAFHGGRPSALPPHTVVLDDTTHPSVVAGARASGASVRSYPRRALAELERLLGEVLESGEAVLASDGVDGFRGELLPLKEIGALADQYDLSLIVDDAHGVGILGPDGRGSWASQYMNRENLIVVGSLAKAFGSSGGFVAGDRSVIDAVRAGPVYTGSTALPPVGVAPARAALVVMRREPRRRERLLALARRLRHEIRELGLSTMGEDVEESAVPVITLSLDSPAAAMALVEKLARLGIHIAHFTYTSGATASMVRIPLSARHREGDVERLMDALKQTL